MRVSLANCYRVKSSGQIEGSLPLADGKENSRARHGLGGIGRQLDIVCTGHDRGEVAISRKAGRGLQPIRPPVI